MSTNASKLFNRATVLQNYIISINGNELSQEDVMSLEIKYNYWDLAIRGNLFIKDTAQIANLNIFDGNTTVSIFAMDVRNIIYRRTFRVINVQSELSNERFNSYKLELMDPFYYKMSNVYISKSFDDTKKNGFQAYLDYLNEPADLAANNVSIDFDDTGDSMPFVVPGDRPMLDYFIYEFNKKGFRLFQERKFLKLKNLDFNSYPEISEEFTNDTDNDMYGRKIHDFVNNYNDIGRTNSNRPIEKNLKFDYNKIENYETKNLTDVYGSMQMNITPMDTLQQTTGKKLSTQEVVTTDNQKFDIEELYIKNNTMEIVVPGTFENEIGRIITVQLKGNPMVTTPSLEGDIFHTGKYFCSSITDRYVGDKMVQKLTINRIDFGRTE